MTLTPEEEKLVDRIEEALISGDPVDLIKEIYATPEGGGGCCWHIVTDDFNLEDVHVEYCAKMAKAADHALCIALGNILRGMSESEREDLMEEVEYR